MKEREREREGGGRETRLVRLGLKEMLTKA